MKLESYIQSEPLLAQLPARERQSLDAAMHERDFAAGEALIRQGDADHTLYILLEGEVAVVRTHNGSDHELTRMREGELIGLIALLDDQKRSATCRALSEVRVAALTHADFGRLSLAYPVMALALQRVMASQMTRDYMRLDRQLREALALEDTAVTIG